ncbi:hypothetical protein GCM10027286_00420 [Virgibacillus ainsalahensis]
MVPVVATLDPDDAANIAEAPTVDMARPPLILPNHFLAVVKISVLIPDRNINSPIKINIGIVLKR